MLTLVQASHQHGKGAGVDDALLVGVDGGEVGDALHNLPHRVVQPADFLPVERSVQHLENLLDDGGVFLQARVRLLATDEVSHGTRAVDANGAGALTQDAEEHLDAAGGFQEVVLRAVVGEVAQERGGVIAHVLIAEILEVEFARRFVARFLEALHEHGHEASLGDETVRVLVERDDGADQKRRRALHLLVFALLEVLADDVDDAVAGELPAHRAVAIAQRLERVQRVHGLELAHEQEVLQHLGLGHNLALEVAQGLLAELDLEGEDLANPLHRVRRLFLWYAGRRQDGGRRGVSEIVATGRARGLPEVY